MLEVYFGDIDAQYESFAFGNGACAEMPGHHALETFIGAVPAQARALLLGPVLGALATTLCRRVMGYGDRSPGLARLLLVVDAAGDADASAPAGWLAIVEPGAEPQPMWEQVKKARNLTQCQAVVSAVIKLIFWHWSQPAVYLWVLGVYRCYIAKLGPAQQDFAAVVAAREVLYLCSTVLAAWQCPVFLLMDPVEAWNEADSKLEKSVRVATYLLTPHNYTAFCLANRFRGWRRTFLGLAGIQVLADLASCVALAALMAGGIEEETKKPPAALKIGYIVTAFGFLMFFGPLSVAGSLSGAFDRRKHWCRRMSSAVGGTIVMCGWTFIVVMFILLTAEQDVFCKASEWGVIKDPCHGHGKCYAAAQCRCHDGFGPEVSFDNEDLCACEASKQLGCGEHGSCNYSGEHIRHSEL